MIPLLKRMILLHERCNYRKLLDQYCRTKVSTRFQHPEHCPDEHHREAIEEEE
jgi:hypothetical protein